MARADDQLPAGRHRIAAVEGQVEDHLLELSPVGAQAAGRRIECDLELDLLADEASQHRFDPRDDLVHLHDLRLEDLPPAEGQELLGQAGGPLGGVANAHDILADVRAGRLVERQVGEADDGRQDVVEVVGDAAGQPADRLELAGLEQLGLEAARLRSCPP